MQHLSLRQEQPLSPVERELQEQKAELQVLIRRVDEQNAELQELRHYANFANFAAAGGRRFLKGGKKKKKKKSLFKALDLAPEDLDALLELIANKDDIMDALAKKHDTDNNKDVVFADSAAITITPEQIAMIEGLAGCIHPSPADEVIVQGCDFIVRSNGGSTFIPNQPIGAKGNLIVGWNEDRSIACRFGNTAGFGDVCKKGLNNLIVGPEHAYTESFGGVVFGDKNSIVGQATVAIGGAHNQAFGENAAILGGTYVSNSEKNVCQLGYGCYQ